jgi:Cytochrome c2
MQKLLVAGAILSAGLVAATAASADDHHKAGAAVFKKCVACHTATEPKNKVGPHLQGIIGRAVASLPDYKYSKAMVDHAAEVPVWTEEALAAYLRDPKGVVKGTKMAFAGLKKDEDIDHVIAYLKDPAAAK